MIRRVLTFFCVLALAVAASAQGPSDPNEGLRVSGSSSTGIFTLSWWGRSGRNYFLQQADDLLSGWNYLPLMDSGANQILQWNLNSSAASGFFRLQFDNDLDGLPDTWEIANYGHLGLDPNALAPRGDGLSNIQTLLQGLNPFDVYNGTQPAAGQNTPVVSLASSASGTLTAPAAVTLTATASETGGTIARVDFYQDGNYVGSGSASPYTFQFANLPAGNYRMGAVAVDAAGFSTASNVVAVTVVPTVTTATSMRYVRGTGSDPSYQSYVVAVDFEKGLALDQAQFSGSLPWFMRVQPTVAYQISVSGNSAIYSVPVANPLVAFGAEAGGTPLYTGQSYSFGVGSGGLYVGDASANDLLLSVYRKTDFTAAQTPVAATTYGGAPITLPRPGTAAWQTFAQNGYVQTQSLNDGAGNPLFKVAIQYVSGGSGSDQWGESFLSQWGQLFTGPILVTVTSYTTDYYLKVGLKGRTVVNSSLYWMAIDNDPPTYSSDYSVSFTMDFQARPAWRSTYIDQPHFQGIPLPSVYQGKTLDELLHSTPAVTDTLAAPAANTLLTRDASPELRNHPALDKFVADMGNDPLALTNYVLNEIELTDAVSYNDAGLTGEQSINAGGMNRGALATFLEGQGSPAEQCALLVYLLRKAGYQCEYVIPQTRNGVLMLDAQLSKLLRMQLKGAADPLGNSNIPRLIPVNYPWVAAYVPDEANPGQKKWVHIFPWLKDTAVEEGFDLYQYLPVGYRTGKQWLNHYLDGDATIRDLGKIAGTQTVEYDNPGFLFPAYVKKQLATSYPGVSIDQLGVKFYNRRNYFTRWNDLPRPWQTPTVATADVKESLSAVANIFDTIAIKIYNGTSSATGTLLMQTGDLRMVDLHNRRLLLYTTQNGSNNTHTLKLSLEAFRPDTEGNPAPTPSFATADTLLNKQLLTAALTGSDDSLTFAISYKRHRSVSANLAALDHWAPFLGLSDALVISDERPLRKGDMAALVLNYGRVTSAMLNVHAQRYQTAQQQVAAGSAIVDSEVAQGVPAFLMGMSYYYNVSRTKQQLLDLTKTNILSFFGHGFAKLGPQRNADATGTLINGGQINLIYPKLDMSFQRAAWANNGTLHPDSGEAQELPANDWATLLIGEISAQEHRTIDKFFQKSAAISTVRLLDISSQKLTLNNVFMQAGHNTFINQPVVGGLAVGQVVTGANIQTGSATITNILVNGVIGQQVTLSNPAIASMNFNITVSAPADNVKVDKSNFDKVNQPPWSTSYTATISGTSKTQTLAQWAGYNAATPNAPCLYKSVFDAFGGWDKDYVQALITPGPQTALDTNSQPFYQGMGAFVTGQDNYGAFISDNLNVMNGGWGPPNFVPFEPTTSSINNWSLQPNNDYFYSFVNPFNQPSSVTSISYTPASITLANATLGYGQLFSGALKISDPVSQMAFNLSASALYPSGGAPTITPTSVGSADAALFQMVGNYGSVTQTSDNRNMFGSLDGVFKSVQDPVNSITGEFYVDAMDLRLNGPMPLDIRRNFGSQNLADGSFGYGWKMAYVPYLVVSADATQSVIYATEMDGSVVAYRRQTSPNARWIPMSADNPQLSNVAGDSTGSLTNVFNNRIDKTTSGGSTYYTLTGVDGSIRTFRVWQYPTPGTNGLTRSRPYLQKWQDNRGNFYNFTFYGDDAGEDATTPGYGSLKRIVSSNGNFVGFNNDPYGRIIEAFTGDGRRLSYQYDEYGDLVQVTLPDASTISYRYSHVANANGQGFYSEHLLVEEDKPQGRVLVNEYDTSRRVAKQKSTVGQNFALVTNAIFEYHSAGQVAGGAQRPADDPKQPISGYTLITDVNGHPTKYDYTGGLITQVTDQLNQTVVQIWFQEGDGLTGSYRRSLKNRKDKRGLLTEYQYDGSGNLAQKKITGDLTGAGILTETATTASLYNALNVVTQTTDPAGNVAIFSYTDTAHPYQPTSIEKRAPGGSVSTSVFQYQNVIGTGAAAYWLLQQETKAAGTSDAAVMNYTNNSNGFVTKITRPTGTTDPAVVVNYTYNLRGELASETDALGRVTKYAYDGRGNRMWTEWRDETGALVSWGYDYYNQNGEIEWSDGPRYSPEDFVLRQYDGAGRLSQEMKWRSEASANGGGVQAVAGLDDAYATTFQVHDTFGNLTEIRDPRHYSTTMQYDWLGQMTARQRRNGDANAAVVAGESFLYEPGGEVSQYTNPLGGIATKLYTTTGKLRQQQDSVTGTTLQWRYDLLGRTVRETLSNQSYWTTDYDDFNRTVTRKFYSAANTLLATETTTFDRRGNVISKLDTENNLFATTYDALDRVKSTAGPTGTAASAQEAVTHTYGAAGKVHITVDALGQKTHSVSDALGRPALMQVKDKKNNIIRQTSYAYSPDHNSVLVTEGVGASAVSTTTFTDTFDKAVLVKNGIGTFRLLSYDSMGNLVQSRDEDNYRSFNTYDALGRLATETLPGPTAGAVTPAGAVTTFIYDAAGNLLERQMPGAQNHKQTFDNASRKKTAQLVGTGNATTRSFSYDYYTTGDFVGLLQTTHDPRGVTFTTTYDSFLHPLTVTATGSQPQQNQTTTYGFDTLNRATSVTQNFANPSTGPPSLVQRSYDGYGHILTETVSLSGAVMHQFNQRWDGAGNRSSLASQAAAQGSGAGRMATYTYWADGLPKQTNAGGVGFSFNYDKNGLLTSRQNSSRTQAVTQRDGLGRMLAQANTVGGGTPLSETQTWNGKAQRASYTANRTGSGVWNETRGYDYNGRGQLTKETDAPSASGYADYLYCFDFDLSVPTIGSGLGVRTLAMRRSNANDYGTWQPGSWVTDDPALFNWVSQRGVDAFQRPTSEERALTANLFYGNSATYDNLGEMTWRSSWSSDATQNPQQTLTWDSFGRLVAVSQRDSSSNGFDWSAIYDGLGRRLRTVQQNVAGGANSGAALTLDSYYDPQVEFLEVGVAVNGARTWKVYGPDLNGRYGGLQGIGGLEAVIDETSGTVTPLVGDAFGNLVGTAAGGTMSWNAARVGSYGVLPGSSAPVLDTATSLAQATLWRGKRIDPTGLYYLGARYYEPNSGRFVSPDPLGHGASMDLYSYAAGDPNNRLDPNGRCSQNNSSVNSGGLASFASGGSYSFLGAQENKMLRVQEQWMQHPEQMADYQSMVWAEERERVMNEPGNLSGKAFYLAGDASKIAIPILVGMATEGLGDALLAPEMLSAGRTLTLAKRSIGARHVSSSAPYLDDLVRTGQIPANPRGTYFTLDEGYDALTSFRMQVPHDGAIRVEFSLDQLENDIAIPLGNYGKGPHMEPIARDFPDFGFGGASQRITTSPIQAYRIIDTRTGKILFESK